MLETISLAGSLNLATIDARASVHAVGPPICTVYGMYDASPSQDWFFTERWQKLEREADQDIAQGSILHYDDVESMFADFDTHHGNE